MPEYFSFGQQSGHYFNRPHEAVPTSQVEGSAAWRGSDLEGSSEWRHVLADDEVEEIAAAIAKVRVSDRDAGELRAADFPLPRLSTSIDLWREELDFGRGFVLISGLPIDRFSREDLELFFWCFGLHLGRPGAQNPKGDLLGHVHDSGARSQNAHVRLYETNADIAYHCDAADVVGLLCRNKAMRGGRSRIVSSVSVFNALLAQRPDLAARLFEPTLLDIRDSKPGDALRHIPVVPCRYAAGRLRTFYHSDYFRSVVRHDDVPEPSETERELFDRYEEIARSPDLYLEMDLAPGDIQLVSNHSVLHARTDYEDWPEPERRRHLLRLWLSLGLSD